jgi:hypothetical protein
VGSLLRAGPRSIFKVGSLFRADQRSIFQSGLALEGRAAINFLIVLALKGGAAIIFQSGLTLEGRAAINIKLCLLLRAGQRSFFKVGSLLRAGSRSHPTSYTHSFSFLKQMRGEWSNDLQVPGKSFSRLLCLQPLLPFKYKNRFSLDGGKVFSTHQAMSLFQTQTALISVWVQLGGRGSDLLPSGSVPLGPAFTVSLPL